MIHPFSIALSLLIVLSADSIMATNLRCNEDIHGALQVIENCRACVIFIAPATSPTTSTATTTSRTTRTAVYPRNMFISNVEPSIEELFLFDEKKRRRRRRRRRHNTDTIVHQQCAREIDGPLYGFDQTHCYCNSNQCNSNIQRCIYEVTSKRQFACYHGTNSSQYVLEIRHKCRSCRVRIDAQLLYHYECLTFAEREQNNNTQCTCQRPMCNQDASTCQRFQQIPSRPRAHLGFTTISNSTISTSTIRATSTSTMSTTTIKSTTTTPPMTTTTPTTVITTTMATTTTVTTVTTATTTVVSSAATASTSAATSRETTSIAMTTLLISTTPAVTTSSVVLETEFQVRSENSTTPEPTTSNETTTSLVEIKHLKTVYIEVKNQGNYLSSSLHVNFYFVSNIFFSFYLFDVITSFVS